LITRRDGLTGVSANGPPDGDDDSLEEFREAAENPMWELFKRYAPGHRWKMGVGVVTSVFAQVTGAFPALVLGVAIDALFADTTAYRLPLVPAAVIPETTTGQYVFTAAVVGAAFAIGAGLTWLNGYLWNRIAQDVQHQIRTDTYDLVQELELAFFDENQTGEVMSILNNDVNQLENFLSQDLQGGVRIAMLVVVLGGIMLYLNWQLALVTLVMVPLLAGASYWFVETIEPKYGAVRSSVGALNARLENNIGGIKVIKSFNREPFESERVTDASADYRDANWDAITTRIKFFPSLQLVTAFGYMVTFLVGGAVVLFGPFGPFTNALTVGGLVPFLLYSRRMMYPMRQFGQIVNNYKYAYAAGERIVGLMNDPRTVPEADDPVEPDGVRGRVEFDDGGFGYPGTDDDERVLAGVSFAVEPGEMVGLVGPTGAGKTTLIKLLMRLYDVDEGSVRIDGHDVRELSLESLRDHIGYVGQDPYLFHGTVRENIAYGRDDTDEATLREAIRRAGALEFVEELPDGLDTVVGERGVKLSGGQRQRISIARALLPDPDVLVLDEATSHVDNETEVLIQEGLRDIVADRTTFAIAHRLSTVRDADRILVMDDGELLETGGHDELLAEDGLYANLWRVQVGEVDALPEAFLERAAERERVGLGDD